MKANINKSYIVILKEIEPNKMEEVLEKYLSHDSTSITIKDKIHDCVEYKQSLMLYSLEGILITAVISLFIGTPLAEAAYYEAIKLGASQLGGIAASLAVSAFVILIAFSMAYQYEKNTDCNNRESIRSNMMNSPAFK